LYNKLPHLYNYDEIFYLFNFNETEIQKTQGVFQIQKVKS